MGYSTALASTFRRSPPVDFVPPAAATFELAPILSATRDPAGVQERRRRAALAAAGQPAKADLKLDGVDLMPYLMGKRDGIPHEGLFWRFGNQTAVRMGDWVLVEAHAAKRAKGVKGGKDGSGKGLFNLREDIGQTKDLAAAQPERVRQLQAAWDEWNRGNVPPAWKGGVAKKAEEED